MGLNCSGFLHRATYKKDLPNVGDLVLTGRRLDVRMKLKIILNDVWDRGGYNVNLIENQPIHTALQ